MLSNLDKFRIHAMFTHSSKSVCSLKFQCLPLSRLIFRSIRSLFIQVQETPNPLSLKFLPGQKILSDSSHTYDFTSSKQAKQSPLAMQLIKIPGVKGVFFGEDFITVTRDSEEEDWALIKPKIFATIMNYLQSGSPVITDDVDKSSEITDTTILPEDDEVVKVVKELIESRIKPMVQDDGGDVIYRGFENGIVKIKFQGACTGCPSSTVTLKNGIKNMIQFYVPEVKDILEVTDPADNIVEKSFQELEKSLKTKS